MKLTKSDREAFVAAIMADVPSINYEKRAYDLVEATLYADAPQIVKDFWDAKKRGEIAHHLDGSIVYLPGSLRSYYSGLVGAHTGHGFKSAFPTTWAQLEELAHQNKAQSEKLKSLREQLAAALAGCSTLKQAKERLPEFEKYLPKDRDGTGVSGLPVVANVVAELVAVGWPKGKAAA